MNWQHSILLWLNHWHFTGLDVLLTWVSAKAAFTLPLALLLLVDSARRNGRDGMLFWLLLLLTVAMADVTGNGLKSAWPQYRPCYDFIGMLHGPPCSGTLTGMPSNHAANYAAAAMFLTLVTRWRAWHIGLWLIVALVSLSRMYLAKHYPGQVLAGLALGSMTGLAGYGLALLLWPAGLRRLARNAIPSLPDIKANAILNDTIDPFSIPPGDIPAHTLSVVIPLYNERDNVAPLVARVHQALDSYPMPWELILVDDGSADGTERALAQALTEWGSHVRVLTMQRNFGQTAAMQAGIDAARGDVIATLDGDLQNDPHDIPRMVHRLLREELDLLTGWRKDRKDNLWLRKVPSRLANRLIGKITGVSIHDYGCSLKVYRAQIIKNVRLFGEMHRFIPAWMALQTAPSRIREEVVTHHPRQFGQSKYGISRTFRVIVDLLSVYFFLRFLSRPGHFFGRIGLLFGALGGVALGWLFVIKFFLGQDIGDRPLLLTGVLLVFMGVQFLTTGVLGELMARTYFATGQMPYYVRHDSGGQAAPRQGWKTPAPQ